VVRVTRCNNPYRVIEHMKRKLAPKLRYDDVITKGTWFRVYYNYWQPAYRWAKKNIPKNAKIAPRRAR
jgi:hypothetical protein